VQSSKEFVLNAKKVLRCIPFNLCAAALSRRKIDQREANEIMALDDAEMDCQRTSAARLSGGRIVLVSTGAVSDAPS
jgi:hypothetical protein